MEKSEYEYLQLLFRKKLDTPNNSPFTAWKYKQGYQDGVKACMSILSRFYKIQHKEES